MAKSKTPVPRASGAGGGGGVRPGRRPPHLFRQVPLHKRAIVAVGLNKVGSVSEVALQVRDGQLIVSVAARYREPDGRRTAKGRAIGLSPDQARALHAALTVALDHFPAARSRP